MKKEELIKKWLWFGLEEKEAKRYQRKIIPDNLRILKKESLMVSILCAVYGVVFYNTADLSNRGIAIFIGVLFMLLIHICSCYLVSKGQNVPRKFANALLVVFMASAYMTTIYLGTFASNGNLAVTAVGLLIFFQINFDILPKYNMMITTVATIVLFLCSYYSKSAIQFRYDVMDAFLAILIGAIASWEKSKIKWENVIAHERLKKDRDVDLLTGIWNRRAFERKVQQNLAANNVYTMAVAMIDIDKFKRINDKYGHEIGDEYLCHFANIFKLFIRENTIIGRRSGDEFFLFIYNFKNVEFLKRAAEKLQDQLQKELFLLPDETKKEIFISVGISWTQDMNIKWTELLCAADELLYFVKEHGRNSYKIEEYKEI